MQRDVHLSLQVHVPPHPLIKHWLAVARNVQTPPAIFRSAISELSRILLYECVRDVLPTLEGQVETPMGVMADVEFVDPTKPVAVVPILRAGMAMLDQAMTTIPNHVTYHVGYVRDEVTLEAAPYLNKLPASFDMDSKILVTDIMLATGAPPHRREIRSRHVAQCALQPALPSCSKAADRVEHTWALQRTAAD